MIRSVLGSRASISGPLGSGRGGAVTPWWLAGGVSAANCVAAYQPIGASSLAASYDNIAAPGNGLADGTYDAAPGVAPTFDTATGWTFAAASTQYLTTGITPATGWSMLVRFTNGVSDGGVPIGQFVSGARFFIQLGATGLNIVYGSGGVIAVSPGASSGIFAIAGQQGYRNGSADGSAISAWTTTTTKPIFLGALNNAPTTQNYFSGSVQAAAIYNTTLTAPQVAAISAAMAAL